MKEAVVREIESFVSAYPEERGTSTRWGRPLIGFADTSDPLFARLKSVVSPTHAMPSDFLGDAGTVIAFFLPFEKHTAQTNVKGRNSSLEWATAYIETNTLIRDMNIHARMFFESRQYTSSVIPATHNFDHERLLSDWSHRHVAFIAGLGRFGMNNMLITASGCCGRYGSVVTNAGISPDIRPDAEFCLYYHDKSCAMCVEHCVNGALSIQGFDRHKCYEMLLENERVFASTGQADVCGKCMVGVPCTHTNPVVKTARRRTS